MDRVAFLLLGLACNACMKQGGMEPVYDATVPICINEVFAAGTYDGNEPDDPGDWLELYNAGAAVRLGNGEWFLTDDVYDLLKFELPGIDLGEQEYVRIWCDDRDGEEEEIHASFRLAGEGEWIALVRLWNGRPCIIDSVHYAPQHEDHGLTAGRYPDGTQAWVITALPTPGGPNEVPAYGQ